MRRWGKVMKLRSHAAFLTMSCALAFAPVQLLIAVPAETASCASLTSELRQLQSRGNRPSAGAQKWQTAKSQQQKALSAAERDFSYLGCNSNASPQCQALSGKVQRMRSNLRAIDRQLAKAGGGSSGNQKRIRQVQAALKRQNCGAPASTRNAAANPNSGDAPRSLLARLFNPQQTPAQTKQQGSAQSTKKRTNSSGKRRIPSGGTFRTLCVRTCDGYFFPVSFATGKRQFANDAARCNEICPASETELYVYKNPGGDRSDMMSLAGDLYSEQPFADRYKSEFVEGCSCRLTGKAKSRSGWTEVSNPGASGRRIAFSDISSGLPPSYTAENIRTSRPANLESNSTLSRTPLTKEQLPAYEDPDTRANLEKGFDVTASIAKAAEQLKPAATEDNGSNGKPGELPLLGKPRSLADENLETASIPPVFKSDDPGFRPAPDRDAPVRVVGPEYFYAQ